MGATATPTAGPTPTASLTLTPTTEPTPNVIPAFIPAAVDAPYLDEPPQTVPCDGPGHLFRSQFPSDVGGPQRSYHAYLPPCYGLDGRAYPVLYLLHGSVETDSHWADLGLARQADLGLAAGRYPPFIAIMPYSDQLGNTTSGGDFSIEGITVNSLVPYVQRTFCAWNSPAGRAIGGISRGGYWALEIAFRHPDLFGIVAGHSSHLRLETDAAKYNPLATYVAADLSHTRIWLDWGDGDFLWAGQEQLHQSLAAANIPHEAHANPGRHSETYWAVHLDDYLTWYTAAWSLDRSTYPACVAQATGLRYILPPIDQA